MNTSKDVQKTCIQSAIWKNIPAFVPAVCLLLLVCFLCQAPVHAAESRLSFTDGSGRYLIQKGTAWYLKDSEGQPLTSLQYLEIPATDNIYSGYYMFDSSGKLIQKRAVYYFGGRKVHNFYFKGFYYTASQTGRFCYTCNSCYYLNKLTCKGKTFDGIYYVGKMGLISAEPVLRKMPEFKIQDKTCKAGYYFFQTNGRLDTRAHFRKLDCTVNGTVFNGYFYFADGGRLLQKEGMITVDGKKYYISSMGRRFVNCWKGGYYWLSNGTMAVSTAVPGGLYVDCNGHKCGKNEVKLSPLRYKLKTLTSGMSGTWSVYIKDLKTGDVVLLNNTKKMYSASIIKLYCMAAVYDKISKNQLADNSVTQLYLRNMISYSDNECFNQLVKMLGGGNFSAGFKVLNQYIRDNGYTLTEAHHTCTPAKSGLISDGSGLQNTTCAYDAGLLLEKVYKGTCVNSTYSGNMLRLLLAQRSRNKIPAGLPAGTKVANKTGENAAYNVEHDTAIIYGPETTYILCVFSSTNSVNGISGIRKISQTVYQYLN